MSARVLLLLAIPTLLLAGCAHEPAPATPTGAPDMNTPTPDPAAKPAPTPQDRKQTETATFGAGCFWCVEAVFEQLDGVLDVQSGYMGGTIPNPTYQQVCSGTTGHAEVVHLTFDPARISFGTLCDWFFKLHDPTTLNRQGPDEGTQYRSAIFFHSEAQRREAEAAMERAQKAQPQLIVTEITAAAPFYSAEQYHQQYLEKRGMASCHL